jgi:hypothetical protein
MRLTRRPPLWIGITLPMASTIVRCARLTLSAAWYMTADRPLDAFFTDRHACGDVGRARRPRIACDCGASMPRRVDDDDRRAAG